MATQIFKIATLQKGSFFQRIFKQYPGDNAIIEVNNLLAIRDILSIKNEEIEAIGQKYELNLQQEYALNLQEFYAVLWNQYLKLEDSSDMMNQTNHLAALLNLKRSIQKSFVDP
ncbi:MAG: hypothetical protein EOO03_16965, partial [Chitinophagaceae bacterium]